MWDRIRNWRWAIAIAALLLAGIGYTFWPDAEPVDLATVTRGPMSIGVTDDGVTRVRELYTVTAPVTGYVTRIELEPGDAVIAGETVIARMAGMPSPPLDQRSRAELANAINAARAAERGAEAALRLARDNLGRAEALAQRGFLSKSELETRRTSAITANAELARIRAETSRLESLRSEPAAAGLPAGGNVAVRSPESGVVLRRLSESEGVVPQGTPLVEIGNPAQIEVVADLLSREAAQVRPSDPVEITRWGGDGALPGRVRSVEPFGTLKVSALGIEEQRVNVVIDFTPKAMPRAARLGHGYQVDATVILWRDASALRLPIGALFRGEDGGWKVFQVENGRARLRPVRIAHINEEYGEVTSGIAAGAQIILNPSGAVRSGTRVRPRD